MILKREEIHSFAQQIFIEPLLSKALGPLSVYNTELNRQGSCFCGAYSLVGKYRETNWVNKNSHCAKCFEEYAGNTIELHCLV